MKTAFISGASGQDASYLAKFLLDKKYKVIAGARRSGERTFSRLKRLGILDDIEIVDFDLMDFHNMLEVVKKYQPDEFYNLAAQSFVGTSFRQPLYTLEVNGKAVCQLVDIIHEFSPHTKFYQASTSEMFGEVRETPQSETTPFNPVSPYGIAKLMAHNFVEMYRKSYGFFGTCGILFNHESILKNSPIIVKEGEMIDIIPIEDMFRTEGHRYEGIINKYLGTHVWNGSEWTEILNGTCYSEKEKNVKLVQTRSSIYEATEDHVAFTEDNEEIPTGEINEGDKLYQTEYPDLPNKLKVNKELARFVGFLVGDGCVYKSGKMRLTGTNRKLLEEYAELLCNQFGWEYKVVNYGKGYYENSKKDIYQLDIFNNSNFGKWLYNEIYTKRSHGKRVPRFILNGSTKVKKAFIEGYYDADGRKEGHEKYKYKGFTTNSATLCLGLVLLFEEMGQTAKVKCEMREGRRYYYCQLRNGKTTGKGEHLKRPLNEVIKVLNTKSEDGWFFDIQTTSKTFATGANLVKIHNSALRGDEFVTKKITNWVRHYRDNNTDKPLQLGNIYAQRDWGWAGDYVRAMWMMLQEDSPNTYVIASGEKYSVKDFVEMAFKAIDVELAWDNEGVNEYAVDTSNNEVVVEINEKFYRPCDVETLLGDTTKARKQLKWKPKKNIDQLVADMVNDKAF